MALPACCFSGLCCIFPIIEVMFPFNEEGAAVSPVAKVAPVGVTMVEGAPGADVMGTVPVERGTAVVD